MARYEHLPIYKQAMEVAIHVEKVVAGFSRYHKYTLGNELRNQSRMIVSQIIRANAERDKAPALLVLRGQLDELFILIRLAKEVQAFKSFQAWYLQLDVRNDFMTIDKAILWRLLEPRLVDPDARWLTELLVFHEYKE